MRCSKCRAENLPDARFCESCGASLERGCPACGASTRADARFCRRCGAELVRSALPSPAAYTPPHLAAKILTTRRALEGERKQVTVLFADIKGSLELAEQLDPEEWHRIMERFFEILTRQVHRFEGTVNQYTGDGIMALFGAPIAHEDHAQRACYAALSLREDLRAYADELRVSRGFSFSVRMGMNSGEVVVGKIGDDLRMDYTAQGHAVGLAARMEQLAQPGTVLLTAQTAALVSGYFALRDLGESRIKGVSELSHVYELEGVGSLTNRFDRSRARGLSRFVGRAQETALLEAALARAVEGAGQVVGIVAEPGAGKSRLCHEVAQRCRARGIEVLSAAAVPHGRSAPFLPMLQILRGLCGVSERDAAEEARRKIAGALLLRDEKFREDLPLLFDFLGVADPAQPRLRAEPEIVQRRLFGVIRRLIATRELAAPSVLVLEDLQWLDGASAAALDDLIDALPTTRTLLLVNFRPEFHAAWMARAYYQELALKPLGVEATQALLADLLGPDPSLAELAPRILARASGNPFFIEEIVQTLAERGELTGARGAYRAAGRVDDAPLPPTVQAALDARIDRLADHEKDVLQAAAVIGDEFRAPLLERVAERDSVEVDAALHALVAAELIVEALHLDGAFAFKHPLTQEAAYHSQLQERRSRLHARVAQAIEALEPELLDERAAVLAKHWEAAGDARRAADWHRRAAVWVGLRDRGEMLQHWRQVRALLDIAPSSPETAPTRVQARIQLLHNSLFLGKHAEDPATLFREGMDLAETLNVPDLRIWLLGEYAMIQLQSGSVNYALELAREATRLADSSSDALAQLRVRVAYVWVLVDAGLLNESLAVSDEAEELSGGDPDAASELMGFSPLGGILTLRAAALGYLGRIAEAQAAIDRALDIGRRRDDTEVLTWAHTWGMNVRWMAGDAAGALSHARRAVECAEAAGSVGMRGAAFLALTRAQLESGDPAAAAEALERGRCLAGPMETDHTFEPLYFAALARLRLALGELDAAREAAERALTRSRECPPLAVVALLTRARVLAAGAHEARESVDADLRRAEEISASMAAQGLIALVHRERAALA